MKRLDFGVAIGLLLIAVGVVLLLQTLNIATFAWPFLWAILFAAGGVVFLSIYARRREQWWPLIPGLTLLAIGVLIGLESIVPGGIGDLGGSIVLGGISLAFWGVYLSRRDSWWPLIPAGTLLTLAVAVAFSTVLEGDLFAGAFLLGLGLTFGLVYLVPTPKGRQTWAVYPAAILVVMGIIMGAAAADLLVYGFAAALIVGGLYLALRALRPR